MIWRSLTFFSLLVTVCPIARGISLSGTVQLLDSHVDAVNRRKDYSGIVVSVRPLNQTAPAPPSKHLTMLQKGKMFTPHVLPVELGSYVAFPNSDLIFH